MMHAEFMQLALDQAKLAATNGEIPIGAVIVKDNNIVAQAHNLCEATHDPTNHTEMVVIRDATKKLNNWRLNDCTLYVTAEPCPMCLGALFQARVGALVFGCHDPKRSTKTSKLSIFPSLADRTEMTDNNHTINITGGILAKECGKILQLFFRKKRIP